MKRYQNISCGKECPWRFAPDQIPLHPVHTGGDVVDIKVLARLGTYVRQDLVAMRAAISARPRCTRRTRAIGVGV